ncbi:MAG: CBS domain-containing protein [Gammaproteobacteria bacterium]|nr:CBS domain-containing protein [Gammaproteobacteria bacterium]
MITIEELMTTNPYSLTETDTLEDARKMMTEKNIRHIPITDQDNKLQGLVTQRDILQATNPAAPQQDAVKLADIMIKHVSVIHTTDSLRQAALFLQSHKYGCLPVVSDDRLVGIITDSDFITIAINLLEQVELAEEADDYEPDAMDDFGMPEIEEEL